MNSAAARTVRIVYTVQHWRRYDRWRIRESVIVVLLFVNLKLRKQQKVEANETLRNLSSLHF
jgi:hypothetical protein